MGNLKTALEIVIAAIGLIFTILTFWRLMLDSIWQWTQLDRSKEIIEARGFVQYQFEGYYKTSDGKIDQSVACKIAPIINSYNHLGMLNRMHYIPLCALKHSSGMTMVIIYERLENYINDVRMNENEYYAGDFEHLYKKLKKYYEKEKG